MNVGDKLAVRVDRFDVAFATIDDISDGKVTMTIPATRIVMPVRYELADVEYTPETDRVISEHLESATPAVPTPTTTSTAEAHTASLSDANNSDQPTPIEDEPEPTITLRERLDGAGEGLHGRELDSSLIDRD